MKVELPAGLPFQPDDPEVEVEEVTWEGNVEKIRYKWKGRTFEEKRVWFKTSPHEPEELQAKRQKLTARLSELELNLKDDAITRLLMALYAANYDRVQPRIRERVHLVATFGYQLKTRIAQAIGTSDPVIIKQILTLDLGYPYPPLADYVVRNNLAEEIKALETFFKQPSR